MMPIYAYALVGITFVAWVTFRWSRGGILCTKIENALDELRDEQDHKCKDRVRIIIICGNCGAPYHVPELTRGIEIECSCGKKYAPWTTQD